MASSIERHLPNSAFLRSQSREKARQFLQASGLVMTGACMALSAAVIAGAETQGSALVTGVAGGAALLGAAHEQSLQALLDMKSRFAQAVHRVRQMPQARRDAVLTGAAGAVGLAIAIHMMQAPAPVITAQLAPMQLPKTMLTELVRHEQGASVARGEFVVVEIGTAVDDRVEELRMLEREGYGVREGQGTAWVAASRDQLSRLESAARELHLPMIRVSEGEAFFADAGQSESVKRDMARWVHRMTQGEYIAPTWLADAMTTWAAKSEQGAPHP